MTGLIDIGANLSHESFQADLEQVLRDARAAGLDKIVVTGTCPDSNRKALALARRFPGFLYSTAGLHPHEADTATEEAWKSIRLLAAEPEVVAVGETGLDFNRNYSSQDNQERAFCAQLSIAADLQKPVFLHQRDAHERFFPILRESRDRLLRGVVHCFTGTRQELRDYLDLDMYIGITGWICDERRGRHLHGFISDIPPERLLIETDAPYLLPRNIKPKPSSRRNEPKYLPYVLTTVAACLGRTDQEVAALTHRNAEVFFGL